MNADDGPATGPGPQRVPIRYVLPPSVPLEYVTNISVHDYGPDRQAYELRFHRAELPYAALDGPPDHIETTCVARVVVSDSTAKDLVHMLVRFGARLGLELMKGADEDVP